MSTNSVIVACTVWILGTIVGVAWVTKDARDCGEWGVAVVIALVWPIALAVLVPVAIGFYIGRVFRQGMR
jgi:hypothetical protein